MQNAKPQTQEPLEISRGIFVCPDAAGVAREAARRFVELYKKFIGAGRQYCTALPGDDALPEFHSALAHDELSRQVDWAKVHLFWTDERTVPPDHADSHYGMAQRELLSRIPIPLKNVHRMEAERAELGRAAQAYEDTLIRFLKTDVRGFPRFHLILLGLGADGHTAALFPGAARLGSTSRWVSTPQIEHLHCRRMTLTLPVLNAAEHVIFLVSGAEKAAAVRRVVEGMDDPPLPAQLVRPASGACVFFVDAAAATHLVQQERQ